MHGRRQRRCFRYRCTTTSWRREIDRVVEAVAEVGAAEARAERSSATPAVRRRLMHTMRARRDRSPRCARISLAWRTRAGRRQGGLRVRLGSGSRPPDRGPRTRLRRTVRYDTCGGGQQLHRGIASLLAGPGCGAGRRSARCRLHLSSHRPCGAVLRRAARSSSTCGSTLPPSTRRHCKRPSLPEPKESLLSTRSGRWPTTTRSRRSLIDTGSVRARRCGLLGWSGLSGPPVGQLRPCRLFLAARPQGDHLRARAALSPLATPIWRRGCASCRVSGWRARYARQHSSTLPMPVFDELGYNYKLSDILAAIAHRAIAAARRAA